MTGSEPNVELGVDRCDDGCGRVAALVVTDVSTRDVDLLCWPCLMRRALEVAQQVTSETDGG